jgi:succinoglycan biosynthesis transport protein ExoP
MGPAMDVWTFMSVVSSRRWLLIACTLAAAGLALAVSLTQSDRYQASAHLLFGRTTSAETLFLTGESSTPAPEGVPATNLALASLDSVAARGKPRLCAPVSVDKLKHAVDVMQEGQSDLVTVTAEWSTPKAAAQLANAFADEIVALRRDVGEAEVQRAIDAVNRRLAAQGEGDADRLTPAQATSLRDKASQLEVLKSLQTGDVQVIERATPPRRPTSPRPMQNAILGGVAGLILGLLIVAPLARFDQRVRTEKDLAALIPAPVLARIPVLPHTWGDERLDEAFHFLRLNLQLTGREGQSRVFALTAPRRGSGTTTVVAGLASSLAVSGSEVIAVDFDLRRPMLHSYLGVEPERRGGVLEALLGDEHGADLLQQAPTPHLRLLLGSDHRPAPAGRIGFERMHDLLEQLRVSSDDVLVDTPPVSAVADASALAATADAVILVIDLKWIRRKELLAAKEQLTNGRATILGIVLNRVPAGSANHVAPDNVRLSADAAATSPASPTFTT